VDKNGYIEMLKRARTNLSTEERRRFEMPVATTQQIGRQTIIKNFSDIAKTLRRDAKHIATYLFKELAMPGGFRRTELYLQGKISSNVINKRLEEYVKEFVLCRECSKPDTIVQKVERFEFMKCEACGAKRPLKVL